MEATLTLQPKHAEVDGVDCDISRRGRTFFYVYKNFALRKSSCIEKNRKKLIHHDHPNPDSDYIDLDLV
jgi:hypothetical protein